MNSTQKFIINKMFGGKIYYTSKDNDKQIISQISDDNEIIIEQIDLCKDYYIYLNTIQIPKIEVYKNKKWVEIKRDANLRFDLNLDNRFEKIKLYFANHIIDDLVIKVKYILKTDEEIQNIINENKRTEYIEKTRLGIKTGDSLANIVFNPCCDFVEKAKISLFMNVGGYRLIGKYDINDGIFFKSVTGLAYGLYKVRVEQFDKNDNLLVDIEKEFELKSQAELYPSKHTVII